MLELRADEKAEKQPESEVKLLLPAILPKSPSSQPVVLRKFTF